MLSNRGSYTWQVRLVSEIDKNESGVMLKNKDVRCVFLLIACLVLVVGGLYGCKADRTAQVPPQKKQKSEEALVIGIQGARMKKVVLSNETSMTITAVMLKGSTETTWTQQPVMSRPWNNGEKALLYYSEPATPTAAPPSATVDPDHDIVLSPALDVQLTFEDGDKAVLHALQLEGLTGGSFCFDASSGLAYLSYSESGRPGTTLDAEKAFKAQQEAAAKAAAQKAAAAKAAADKAAAGRAKTKSTPQSSGKKNKGSSGSSGVKQKSDPCVGDLLLN